ncbi:MAG TPA: carboxypeptidase regulatory-like domain-containing protein [Longimicrobiaceae bacterium]|jgi:hypothetical protein|nr:carboxypeptidase regulatory-like domain-containing protein [Longimicrobiaceae bacterium]
MSALSFSPARLRGGALLAAALLAQAAASTHAAAQRRVGDGTAVVVGTVIDATTQKPVAAARIALPRNGRNATADRLGRFTVGRLQPGSHPAVVHMIGYREKFVIWEVGPDTTRVQVAMEAIPVALAGLKVQVDRFERRRLAVGVSSRTASQLQLLSSTAPDAAQFLADHFGLSRIHCGGSSGGGRGGLFANMTSSSMLGLGSFDCFRVRGEATRPCVVIDERPAYGMDELATYRPEDLYRLDVYHGGSFIQAYTVWFMEGAAKRPFAPTPVSAQMNQFCTFTR